MSKKNWVEVAKDADRIENFLERIKGAREIFANVTRAEVFLAELTRDISSAQARLRAAERGVVQVENQALSDAVARARDKAKAEADLEVHKDSIAATKLEFDKGLAGARQKGELAIKNMQAALAEATKQHTVATGVMARDITALQEQLDVMRAERKRLSDLFQGINTGE